MNPKTPILVILACLALAAPVSTVFDNMLLEDDLELTAMKDGFQLANLNDALDRYYNSAKLIEPTKKNVKPDNDQKKPKTQSQPQQAQKPKVQPKPQVPRKSKVVKFAETKPSESQQPVQGQVKPKVEDKLTEELVEPKSDISEVLKTTESVVIQEPGQDAVVPDQQKTTEQGAPEDDKKKKADKTAKTDDKKSGKDATTTDKEEEKKPLGLIIGVSVVVLASLGVGVYFMFRKEA